MKLKLPSNLATPRDIDEIVIELKDYAKWHAHAEIKKQGDIKTSNPPEISDAAAHLVDQAAGKTGITDKQLDKLINSLLDIRDYSPELTIVLAAQPTGAIKHELISWCRENLSQDILIRFSADRTILGGMVVQCGSHIYDWSFKHQITKQMDMIPKVLRSV